MPLASLGLADLRLCQRLVASICDRPEDRNHTGLRQLEPLFVFDFFMPNDRSLPKLVTNIDLVTVRSSCLSAQDCKNQCAKKALLSFPTPAIQLSFPTPVPIPHYRYATMVYFKDEERKHLILRGRKRKRAKRQKGGEEKQLYWKSATGEVVEKSHLDKKQRASTSDSFRMNAQKDRRQYAEEFERLESSKMEPDGDSVLSSPPSHRKRTPAANEVVEADNADDDVNDDTDAQSQVVHTPYTEGKDDPNPRSCQNMSKKSLGRSRLKDSVDSGFSNTDGLKTNFAEYASNGISEIEALRSQLADQEATLREKSKHTQERLRKEEQLLEQISAVKKDLGINSRKQTQQGKESTFEQIQRGIAELGLEIAELLKEKRNHDPLDLLQEEENVLPNKSAWSEDEKSIDLAELPVSSPAENGAKRENALTSLGGQASLQRSNSRLLTSGSTHLQEVGQLKVDLERCGGTIREQHSALTTSKEVEAAQAEKLCLLSQSIEKHVAEKKKLEKAYASMQAKQDEQATELENERALRVAELENRDAVIASLRNQHEESVEIVAKLKTELAGCKHERDNELKAYMEEREVNSNRLAGEEEKLVAANAEIKRLDIHAKSLEHQLATLETQHKEDAKRSNDELEALAGKNVELEMGQEEWKHKSGQASAEIQRLLAEISKLQASLSEREKELAEYKADLEDSRKLRDDFEQTTEKLRLSCSEISSLKEKMEKLEADKEFLDAKLESTSADLQGSFSTIAELKSKLADAEAETSNEIRQLVSTVTNMKEEKVRTCKRLAELQASGDELQNLNNHAEGKIEELRLALETERARAVTDRETSQTALLEMEADRSNLQESLTQARNELERLDGDFRQNQTNYQRLQEHSKEALRKSELELATLKGKLEGAMNDIQSLTAAARDCQEKLESERRATAENERKLLQELRGAERIADGRRKEVEEKCREIELQEVSKRGLLEQAERHESALKSLQDELRELKTKNNALKSKGRLSSETQFGRFQHDEGCTNRTQSVIDQNLKKAVDKAALIVQLANSDIDKTEKIAEQGKEPPMRATDNTRLKRKDDARCQTKPSLYGHLPENEKPENSSVDLNNDGPTKNRQKVAEKVTYDGKTLRFRKLGKQPITIYSDSEDERSSH